MKKTSWTRLLRAALLAIAGFGLTCCPPSTALQVGVLGQAAAQTPEIQSPSPDSTFNAMLAAGEFGPARASLENLPPADQDAARQRLAVALANAGMSTVAVDTASQMGAGPAREQVMRQLLRQPARSYPPRQNAPSYPAGYDTVGSGKFGAGKFGAGDSLAGGRGGAAIADFDSLIELIETTIAPDTWEALGGPSTMSEYRAGIYVDPAGLVHDIEIEQADRLTNLRSQTVAQTTKTSRTGNTDWTRPAKLRVVSLAGLRSNLLKRLVQGANPTSEIDNLAGLSSIQYVIILDDDVLFVGTVGGIDPASVPWPIDSATGRTTLGLDLLMVAAKTVDEESNFGCSIDPSEAGLQAAAKVSEQIGEHSIPAALAAETLASALGRQKVSLFNVAGDHALAWLLVDADRHMKKLALGVEEMPNGVSNYLQFVESRVQQNPKAGVPAGQLLRMWFASRAKQVRKSPDSLTFELSGLPVRLLSAREFADQAGQRQQAGNDPLGEQFAAHFSEHFTEISAKYPIYDRLRGAFELTAAMQLVRQTMGDQDYDRLIAELRYPDLVPHASISVPRECDSIAVRHTIRNGRQRHEVYMASGGIEVDPSGTLVSKFESYPQLESTRQAAAQRPVANTRWWWDLP